jgi:hypothetical protein
MRMPSKNVVSFVVMTMLVFCGTSLFGLFGGVSSGPNVDSTLGLFGWLWLHRGSDGVSIQDFYFAQFCCEICLAKFFFFFGLEFIESIAWKTKRSLTSRGCTLR